MIEERSLDGTGWAQFSDDSVMRYRLARSLTSARLQILDGIVAGASRVCFLMLNPSTADAFKLDPTIQNCAKFARRWGADVLEVVNLFAFRSPYPADLRAATGRGDDALNDLSIIRACTGASVVIASWGTGGELAGRGDLVTGRLLQRGIKLSHLGLTKDGHPKHPLARGKHRICDQQQPEAWG